VIQEELVRLLRGRAVERLKTAKADGLFLFRRSNLLGFLGLPLEPSDRLVCGLVNSDGRAAVVVPAFEAEAARHCRCVERVVTWEEHEDPFAAVAETAKTLGLGGGRILMDDYTWLRTLGALKKAMPKARLDEDGDTIGGARIVKHETEIEAIRAACGDVAKVYAFVEPRLQAGVSEAALWEDTARHLRQSGVDQVCLLIQGGETASEPHASAGDRLLAAGDAVVVDCVCVKNGFHGDLTRSFAVGQPSDEVRMAYRVVRAAQQTAIQTIRPGVSCEEVDAAARSLIERAGLGRFFTHRLGHGIGLDGHEPPYLRQGNPQKLEAGMCVTVEPGVYVPGRFGIRIEDVVAVTAEGCEVLSKDLPTDVSPPLA